MPDIKEQIKTELMTCGKVREVNIDGNTIIADVDSIQSSARAMINRRVKKLTENYTIRSKGSRTNPGETVVMVIVW